MAKINWLYPQLVVCPYLFNICCEYHNQEVFQIFWPQIHEIKKFNLQKYKSLILNGMFGCIHGNNLNMFEFLFSHLGSQNFEFERLLSSTIWSKKSDFTEYVLKKGALYFKTNPSRCISSFVEACAYRDEKMILLLKNYGIYDYYWGLYGACKGGNEELFNNLTSNSHELLLISPSKFKHLLGSVGMSGNIRMADFFLNLGVLNITESFTNGLLCNHLPYVQFLYQKSLNDHILLPDLDYIFKRLCVLGNLEMIKFLLSIYNQYPFKYQECFGIVCRYRNMVMINYLWPLINFDEMRRSPLKIKMLYAHIFASGSQEIIDLVMDQTWPWCQEQSLPIDWGYILKEFCVGRYFYDEVMMINIFKFSDIQNYKFKNSNLNYCYRYYTKHQHMNVDKCKKILQHKMKMVVSHYNLRPKKKD